MTDVVLNRIGIDHVSLTMTTQGSSVAMTTLNELLLDPTKEYCCRVTEINAPINSLPIFGFDAADAILDEELFRIKYRGDDGTVVTKIQFDAGYETTNLGVPFESRLRTKGAGGRIMYAQSSFLTEMGRHANSITQGLDKIGFAPFYANDKHEYFKIRLNADGCAEFIGSSVFWNFFVVQFTERGKVLFGTGPFCDENNIMAVSTRKVTNVQEYKLFDNNTIIDLSNHANYKKATDSVKIVGSYPLFKNLDLRYFVSVETDLLVQQSIKVVDGKQSVDQSIAKSYFPSTCKVNLQSEGGILKEDCDIQLETRVGQFAFIKKTQPSDHWVSLKTSYDVRFFRFNLNVTYRVFDAATQRFLLNRRKYPISQNDSWDISIEFVSKL